VGAGEEMDVDTDGFSYYKSEDSIPIRDTGITVCAADAANPGKRTNADPTEEDILFKLSTRQGCNGDVTDLTVKSYKLSVPSIDRIPKARVTGERPSAGAAGCGRRWRHQRTRVSMEDEPEHRVLHTVL
jgi:hypothetical protein